MRLIGTLLLMIAISSAQSAYVVWAEGDHITWNPTEKERARMRISWLPPTQNDALLQFNGISMPLGRILLARKGSDCCAMKFTDTWLGETEDDHYSSYELYYQGDGSCDFTWSTVLTERGELYFPRIRYIFPGIHYQKGRNSILKCGEMKLNWLYIASIGIEKYELAPTPWKSIEEVDIRDPRVHWYKKGDVKKTISVPIDQLWERPEKKDGPQ